MESSFNGLLPSGCKYLRERIRFYEPGQAFRFVNKGKSRCKEKVAKVEECNEMQYGGGGGREWWYGG